VSILGNPTPEHVRHRGRRSVVPAQGSKIEDRLHRRQKRVVRVLDVGDVARLREGGEGRRTITLCFLQPNVVISDPTPPSHPPAGGQTSSRWPGRLRGKWARVVDRFRCRRPELTAERSRLPFSITNNGGVRVEAVSSVCVLNHVEGLLRIRGAYSNSSPLDTPSVIEGLAIMRQTPPDVEVLLPGRSVAAACRDV
jgi:hypothetical protein